MDMVDGVGADETALTRRIVLLYFPLRSRIEYGKPASVVEIMEYLRLHNLESLELFTWLSVADGEACAFMAEQQKAEMDKVRRRSD